ncbi:MAG: hypothetical protein OEX12_02630 [Gammaproteobacteria bacterium]|nr:hypothetical protein [Gammaproteobacteria bacterium]
MVDSAGNWLGSSGTLDVSEYGTAGSGRAKGGYTANVCLRDATTSVPDPTNCKDITGSFDIAVEADEPVTTPDPTTTAAPEFSVVIDSVVNAGPFAGTITYTVTNNGGDYILGSTNFSPDIMIWGNLVTAPDYTSAQSGAFMTSTQDITTGASVQFTDDLPNSTWSAGVTYDAYVIVDFFENVPEGNETNNVSPVFTWTAL